MAPTTSNAQFYENAYAIRCLIQRFDDSSILTLEQGRAMLNPGIKTEPKMATNALGINVVVDQFITDEAPELELSFRAGIFQPETSELILGRRFANASKASNFQIDINVPAAPSGANTTILVPAKTIGQYGYGAPVDTCFAAVKDATTSLSTQLTRVAAGTTPDLTLTTNTFYQAQHLGFGFSPDLAGTTVSLAGPLAASVITALTDTLVGVYKICAQLITDKGRAGTLYCHQALPMLDSPLDPTAKELKIKFRLIVPAGLKRAYDIDWLNKAA